MTAFCPGLKVLIRLNLTTQVIMIIKYVTFVNGK